MGKVDRAEIHLLRVLPVSRQAKYIAFCCWVDRIYRKGAGQILLAGSQRGHWDVGIARIWLAVK